MRASGVARVELLGFLVNIPLMLLFALRIAAAKHARETACFSLCMLSGETWIHVLSHSVSEL